MQPWAVEYGTFWALEPSRSLPPILPAQVDVDFEEVGPHDTLALADAMNLPTQEIVHQRLKSGRRCFCSKAANKIVTYGWVTFGIEHVGELERDFHLNDDEAYVWDCSTIPSWRKKGCYSTLLSHILYKLHEEKVPRIWIGASRQNRPSIQGIANAGFQWVLDLTYRRFYRFTLLWFQDAPGAIPSLLTAAYRILLNNHEKRIGNLVIGYKTNNK